MFYSFESKLNLNNNILLIIFCVKHYSVGTVPSQAVSIGNHSTTTELNLNTNVEMITESDEDSDAYVQTLMDQE